jgi:hypothetical protein
MLAASIFTLAGLGSYWLLIKSYQLVALARYRDDARAVLQSFGEQFQRLQTSDKVSGTTYTRWLFNPSAFTGQGLLWDQNSTPGVSLNSVSAENSSAAAATLTTGLQVMIGGNVQNGVLATVQHEVLIIDPATGQSIAAAPEQPNEGELLLGTFSITYTVNQQPFTQNLSVLRAAP